MPTPIDEAILKLKKFRQSKEDAKPKDPTPSLFTTLNNNLVGAIADIAEVAIGKMGKTEVTNEPRVTVTNFPKPMPMDHSPVVNAIKAIPELDLTPIVKAIKEIPSVKPTDINPVVKAIQAIPKSKEIDLSEVISAIKSIPKAEKPLEEVRVKNQIALDKVESLLSQLLSHESEPKTDSVSEDGKLIVSELRSLFEGISLALADNKISSIRVSNPGDFPVSPAKASYKNADGTVSDGLVDSDHHVQVDVKSIQELPETDSTHLNPSTHISYDGIGNPTTLTDTIGTNQYQLSLTYDGLGQLSDVSEWVQL